MAIGNEQAAARGGPRRRRGRRILLLAAGSLALLLVLAFLLVPTVASALAPGIIQSVAQEQIKGSVKVSDVAVSWRGPTRIGSIEVFDDAGQPVGRFSATSSLGILAAAGGLKDLGVTTLQGRLDIVARHQGDTVTTNLQRAIEPRRAPASTPAGPTRLPEDLGVTVEITDLDITYKAVDAAGVTTYEAAILDARGTVRAATGAKAGAKAGGAAATASVKLDAAMRHGPGASANAAGAAASTPAPGGRASGNLAVQAEVSNLTDASGALAPLGAKVDAQLQAGGVPVAIVDAVLRQNGLVLEALGESADVTATVKGELAAADVDLTLQSPVASARADLRIDGGRIAIEQPITATLASTAFARRIPAVQQALAKAGVAVDQYPDVRLQVTALNLPAPAVGGGPAASALAALDLRGSTADASVQLGPVAGSAAPREGAAAAERRPFALAPTTVRVSSTDLARALNVRAGTRGTFEGRDAGTLEADLAATELLTPQGALRGGLPGGLSGAVSARGVSTALLTPVLAALDLPLDPERDIGPVADLTLTASTRGGAPAAAAADSAAGAIPPTDLDVQVTSANVRAQGGFALSPAAVTSRGEFTARVESAGPLIARLANRFAPDAALEIGGRGAVQVAVSDVVVPLEGGAPVVARALGRIRAQLTDVRVVQGGARPLPPLAADQVVLAASLAEGRAPAVQVDARLAAGGESFTATADVQVPGLLDAARPPLPALGGRRVIGAAALRGVPTALVSAFAGGAGPARGEDAAAGPDIGALARAVAGRGVDVTLDLAEADDGAAQRVGVTVAGGALSADTSAALTARHLTVNGARAEAQVGPELARSLLQAAGADQAQIDSVRLAGPSTVAMTVAPLRLPLKQGGAAAVDWAAAGDEAAQVAVVLRDPVIVQGLAVGSTRMDAGVAGLNVAVRYPLALAGGDGAAAGRAVTATLGGNLVEGRPARSVGTLAGSVEASGDFSRLTGEFALRDLDTRLADMLAGEAGLASGALGPTAALTVRASRAGAAAPLAVSVQADSPRLRTGEVRVAMDDAAFRLVEPARVEWTVDPAFAARFLEKRPEPGAAPAGGAAALAAPARVTVELRSLAIARGAGPLKPGVFALDAGFAVPQIVLRRTDAEGRAVESTLSGVTGTARGEGGGVQARLEVARFAQEGQGTERPIVLTAGVTNLADAEGRVNAQAAVFNARIDDARVPTALLDAVAGTEGELGRLLGPDITARLLVEDVRLAGGAAPRPRDGRGGGQAGFVWADMRSERSLVRIGGPVRDGVIDTTARAEAAAPGAGAGVPRGGTPLAMELAAFDFDAQSRLLRVLPIFAQVRKTGGPETRPASVSSVGLMVPLGSDEAALRRLEGDITVDLGNVEYIFETGLARLLKSDRGAAFGFGPRRAAGPEGGAAPAGNGAAAPAAEERKGVPPFVVRIRQGVVRYENVEIPVSLGLALGASTPTMYLSGQVDAATRTGDILLDVPVGLVSDVALGEVRGATGFIPGADRLLERLGGASGDMLNTVRVPIRVTLLPGGERKTGIDPQLFGQRLLQAGPSLLGNVGGDLGKGIQDIGKGLGDLLNRDRDRDRDRRREGEQPPR